MGNLTLLSLKEENHQLKTEQIAKDEQISSLEHEVNRLSERVSELQILTSKKAEIKEQVVEEQKQLRQTFETNLHENFLLEIKTVTNMSNQLLAIEKNTAEMQNRIGSYVLEKNHRDYLTKHIKNDGLKREVLLKENIGLRKEISQWQEKHSDMEIKLKEVNNLLQTLGQTFDFKPINAIAKSVNDFVSSGYEKGLSVEPM